MARLRIRDAGGTLRTIVRVRMRDQAGVLKTLQRIRARSTSNDLQIVFQPFAASITPSPVDGYLAGTVTANVTTSSVTAAATGGTAAYTYAWSQIGTSPYTWTINSPAAASTSFTAASVEVGAYATNLFKVIITDANGATATANVSASVRNAYSQAIDTYPDPDKGVCPTLDTLILLANESQTGPGRAIPIGELQAGMFVWTRHELTLQPGAYEVMSIEHVPGQPVCSVRGYPEVTPRHRFALPVWIARILPPRLRWFRAGWFVRPHRTAAVARISIRDAKTYLIRRPSQGAIWRLSHNIKP